MSIKQEVSEFYDRVGWQAAEAGGYQNARYEDLRPVSAEYIHLCHLRLVRHLSPQGRFLLDAGSGPVQYREYLEYSRGYQYRICADISIVALQEARKRLGTHGLYVVADIANLPFAPGSMEGVVSLHTIHHLPKQEHQCAYEELYRVLKPGASATIVNGWERPPLSALFGYPIRMVETLFRWKRRLSGVPISAPKGENQADGQQKQEEVQVAASPAGTFVSKHNAAWLKQQVGRQIPLEIWCWRSVETRFLRAFIHPRLGGRLWLRLLFWLEEKFPHFLGENGQYPLVVLRKPLQDIDR